jgi:uncharacterized protein YecE (DUF72 family)
MWANRDWVGRYLPATTGPGEELAAYARLCTAVEGNTTFYALPTPTAVARWANDAPPDFRFVCKLPRSITHDRRLRHVDGELREFLDRMTPLGERLGPVTVQLPASFGPEDVPVLDTFLAGVSDEVEWAVEVRHQAFEARGSHEAVLDDLLRRHGANRVVIDTRALFEGPRDTPAEIEAFERKPRLAVRPVATAATPIVRFIGRTDVDANQLYWRKWVGPVSRWLMAGLEPIVFLHTPDNADAPALARTFHAAVAAAVRDLEPLPEPLPVEAQPRLW